MNISIVEARDIPDAWYQSVYEVLKNGRIFTIDSGSYAGQKRLELDFIVLKIKYPGTRPLLPDIPKSYGIPNPVADGYLEEYLPYLMTSKKSEKEEYVYGLWLEHQIEEVIKMFKTQGYRTNQACMTVGDADSIYLDDPPCLRLIDCRIQDGKLHFFVYFRSWDCWNGNPANLGAIQLLKEYMSESIGVDDGEIIATSKGLHLYDYVWEIAQQRTGYKLEF